MRPYYSDDAVTLYHGDAIQTLSKLGAGSVDCCVTSPPYYGLRDYGQDGQYGMEESPAAYVDIMRRVGHELRSVLANDGTFWLNLGDGYVSVGGAAGRMASNLGTACLERPEAIDPARFGRWNRQWGLAPKNLLGIPWRVAIALQEDGWILRNAVVWHKPNAMPESVTDRLSSDYELLFLLTKSPRYWFDLDAVREDYAPAGVERRKYAFRATASYGANPVHTGGEMPANPRGRNPGSVWDIPTQPFAAAHFAVMPVSLAERCVLAGCRPGGVVLDPFSGSGTTGLAAARHGRRYVGIDLSRDYLDLSLRTRLAQIAMFESEATP